MTLEVLLPYQVQLKVTGVERLVVETTEGSMGLLPHRLDCVAVLVPGILCYRREGADTYLAVDRGLMVKAGAAVSVSVRNCIVGLGLAELREQVDTHFRQVAEDERLARSALAKIEGGFIRRFQELRHG